MRARVALQIAKSLRWLPAYAWQRFARPRPRGAVHLMLALADHFEPAIVPEDGFARAPLCEQERRLERWCRDYPRLFGDWRDAEGRPFCHTYFYPAEQYERSLVQRLAGHCQSGWGEVEVHLHHGIQVADTVENTSRQLSQFRDALEAHGCLCRWDGGGGPRYAFVHGNFALANSAGGRWCGVDSELQVLAETGCYADLTLPPAAFHPSQIAKINSLYQCSPPLDRRAAHRHGRDLQKGEPPTTFPLIIQGPLGLDFDRVWKSGLPGIENGALTGANPPTLRRLRLWKDLAIAVRGRPDWLFIKLHCHGMDPRPQNEEVMLGTAMRRFLQDVVEAAPDRKECLHFVSAREMVNIILAACDGREGNPGDYRDYRLKRVRRSGSDAGIHERESRAS